MFLVPSRLHLTHLFCFWIVTACVQFLNVAEYIKGIAVYEEIVRAFASYADPVDFNQPVHCDH
jgi:hypothetical protein